MPVEGNNIQQVSEVLSQLHDSGVINLDKSVRDMLAPSAALAELQPGSKVATSVIAWDGYGLVIKGAIERVEDLANVATQLRQAGGGGV